MSREGVGEYYNYHLLNGVVLSNLLLDSFTSLSNICLDSNLREVVIPWSAVAYREKLERRGESREEA